MESQGPRSKAHAPNSLRHTTGFITVQEQWLAGFDGTEAAATRADIAENHKSGRSPSPTFGDIGASGLLADGMEALPSDHLFHFAVTCPGGQSHLKPFGSSCARRNRGLTRFTRCNHSVYTVVF